MNKFISSFLLLMLMLVTVGTVSAQGNRAAQDTIVIELNNTSKILIYTDSPEDLEQLQNYDLNRLIKDLNRALGSEKINEIEISREDGTRYLKDTTIVIGEDGAKTKIKVGNMALYVDIDDWDELEDEFDEDIEIRKYTYEEDKIDRTRHYFNIDFGINNWMESGKFPSGENYEVKPWGSWYIGLNGVNSTWISGPLFLEWGLGISWYNWKLDNRDVEILKEDNRVQFIERMDVNGTKSKLTAPYINVSLVPIFDFAKGKRKVKDYERGSFKFRTYNRQGIRFGVGGYAGYRIGGHTKFVYKEGGDKEKDKDKSSFFMSNFRYGVRAQVGFKGLDVFCMYDLNEVFDENKGPEDSSGLNAITFGITF